MITHETRLESYLSLEASKRKKLIIDTLLRSDGMTAREIAYKNGYNDLNAVKPRLTELRDEGIVEPYATVKDPVTGRRVAKWRLL